MAVYPVVSDIVEMRTVQYTPTQIALNVSHWVVGIVTTGGAHLGEMALSFDDVLHVQYKGIMSDQARWRGVGCRVLGPVTPPSIEFGNITNDGIGGAVSPLLPTQTTYVIRKRTQLAGKQNMGRIYPGFPPVSAANSAGDMTAAYATGVQTLADQYNLLRPIVVLGAGGDTTLLPVLKHAGTLTFTVIDHWDGTTRFATQRRRGQLGKANVLPF